jgi:hypothetical protein
MKPNTLVLVAALALGAAPTSLAQGFEQCGTVEAGVTCPKLFRADDQSLWLLDVSLSAYQVGDRLRVQGTPDPFCINLCQQGNGCMNGSSLLTCGLPATVFCAPGVPNSTGQASMIGATGSLQASANDLTLEARQLPPGSFAIFITSRTITPPFVPPGGSWGNLCLGGSIGRFQQQVGPVSAGGTYRISTAAGSGAQQFSLTTFPQPNGVVPVLAGETWGFQCWHRDSVGGAAIWTFSEGISLTFS